MKKFEFLITDKNGNTAIEAFATRKNTEEAAYDYALRMFPGSNIRLRKDVRYRWYYMAVGFAIGCVIPSVILYIILHYKL